MPPLDRGTLARQVPSMTDEPPDLSALRDLPVSPRPVGYVATQDGDALARVVVAQAAGWPDLEAVIGDVEKAMADENADTEMKDAGEADNAEASGPAEPNPESDSAAPVAESASSPAPAEPAATEKQLVEDVQETSPKGEETQLNGETENGINGQTTTERLASVITGAFLN